MSRTTKPDACLFLTCVTVDRAPDDSGGREMVTLVSEETRGQLDSNYVSSRGSTLSRVESSYAAQGAPSVHDEIATGLIGDSSQNSSVLVNTANSSQSSIPMFQGY